MSDEGDGQSADELREQVGTLRSINDVIREVSHAAVQANGRDELAASVTRELVESGPYVFAWFGERNPATSELEPVASHGDADGYLDAVALPLEDGPTGPARQAVETGTLQVVDDVASAPEFEPWREAALANGFRAAAAVPVVYEGTVYGVVAVYAAERDAFDDQHRGVLSELGETIGLAASAIERRRALVADTLVEVELSVADDEPAAACADADATLVYEGAVGQAGGEFVFYFAVDGDPAAVVDAIERHVEEFQRARVVEGAESLVELVVDGPVIVEGLSAHGGTVTEMTVDAGGTEVTVEFPLGTDVRAALSDLPRETTLLAQRTVERPAWSERQFENRVADRLTDRQRAVLRTAYLAGYHDRPRTSTGEEVAEALGISPSTFHQHHRVGVRKLLGAAFDRPGDDGGIPER